MTVLAALAAACGVAMGAAPFLQIRRMRRVKSARDVSLGFFAVAVGGQLIWVVYGVVLHNLAVIASNGCGMLVNAGVLLTAIALRRTAPVAAMRRT